MEGLKSFFASHRPADLTAEVLENQILRLESKAEEIEYDHWNSQPHLDAAQLLRQDAKALKTVLSRVVASQSPIPMFERSARYHTGAIVLDAGAIWQKTGNADVFSQPGRSDDWAVISGKPIPQPAPAPAVMDLRLGVSAQLPNKTAKDRAELKRWQAIEKDVQEYIKEAGISEASLQSPISFRFLLIARSALIQSFREEISERDEVIDQLRKRIDAIEAGGIAYKGVWQRAATYAKGSIVTDGGSAWIALKNTEDGDKPGDANSWQLMVKAGRNGRDVPAP